MLTDFSTNARHAHQYALELYKDHDVNFFLLHIKKPCLNSQKCSGKCKLGLHQKLMSDAKDLVTSKHQAPPKAVLVEGSFIEEIRAVVIKHNIDILVIGAKGKSTKNQNAIGSYTQPIATKVKCPALIVFENTPVVKPTSALFPVNYTDALYPACLNKLKNLPVWKGLSLKILELKPLTTAEHLVLSSKQILENTLKKQSFEFINLAKQEDSITKEATNFDLLVFAAKNLSVGNKVFSELKQNKEALHFKTPLFILHA